MYFAQGFINLLQTTTRGRLFQPQEFLITVWLQMRQKVGTHWSLLNRGYAFLSYMGSPINHEIIFMLLCIYKPYLHLVRNVSKCATLTQIIQCLACIMHFSTVFKMEGVSIRAAGEHNR